MEEKERTGGPVSPEEIIGDIKEKETPLHTSKHGSEPKRGAAHVESRRSKESSRQSQETEHTHVRHSREELKGGTPTEEPLEEASGPEEDTQEVPKDSVDTHTIYYVASMLAAGQSEATIQHELEGKGYSAKAIESAFEQAKEKLNQTGAKLPPLHEKPKPKGMSFNEKIFAIIYTILIFFLMGWINIETGSPFSIIALSFTPVLLTIAISPVFISMRDVRFKIMLWVVPLLACVGWYALATSGRLDELAQTDAANITILNLGLGMVYVLILDLFRQLDEFLIRPLERKIVETERKVAKETKETTKEEEEEHGRLEQTISEHEGEKTIEQYIQAIEDKSKALNFVIGRVYSNKHGGSDALRAKIRIQKEDYNTFSEIPSEMLMYNLIHLRKALYSIGSRLALMARPEREVLGPALSNLTEIERDPDGNDRVIDVLANNDKDPVMTYYESAVEFCNKAAKEIEALANKQGDPEILKANTRHGPQ